MAHRARHFCVLLLLISTGCVTVSSNWSSPMSMLKRTPGLKKAEKASAPKNEEPEEREPLIAENEPAETETKMESVALQHDPATRMLIETELRDATPEQRAEWLEFLATVETSEVPALLKERRMSLRREPIQVASADTDNPVAQQEIVPAAHSISPQASTGHSPKGEEAPAATEAKAPMDTDVMTANGAGGQSGAWQKKFRSLTDPNWLWAHPSNEAGDEHGQGTGKTERGPFGLPQVRSNRNEPLASAHEQVLAAQPQRQPVPVTPTVEPKITPGSALWEDEIIKLISLLEAEVSSVPGQDAAAIRQNTRKEVALRMLYLVANDPQKALQVIPGLPAEEQEFWTALFLGLAEHLDQAGTNDPAERATHTIAQLRAAAYHLQPAANLRIRNAVFCQQINGFGNYDLFTADQFAPGQSVLIYAEIRNFKSVPTGEGFFLTRIRSTIEIYSTQNGQQLVDRSTFDPTEDRSRSLRTDYYHSYRLDLPANLNRGPHMVKLILQDEVSGKQTTESIQFVVK